MQSENSLFRREDYPRRLEQPVSPRSVNLVENRELAENMTHVAITTELKPKRGDAPRKKKLFKERSSDIPKKKNKKKRDVQQLPMVYDVLSFYMGEHKGDGRPKVQFYEMWQLEHLKQQLQTLSLGLFIIRLPNPDNPSKHILKHYQSFCDQQKDIHMINQTQAFDLFTEFFSVDSETNINLADTERCAFNLAFYLLNLPQIQIDELKQVDPGNADIVERFLYLFEYFRKIKDLTIEKYDLLRKQDFFVTQAEYFLKPELNELIPQLFSTSKTKPSFLDFKKKVKRQLAQILHSIGLDEFSIRSDDNTTIRIILGLYPNVSEILEEFPRLTQLIFDYLRSQAQNQENDVRRLLLRGGQMTRQPHRQSSGQFIWTCKSHRPRDLLSLFRNIVVYKLTRRANLFVRQFLSRRQDEILLVVDTLEDNLERYAQSKQILMEIDMGSIDLFSFEPIDMYNRPLRLHKYIRDRSFYEKYRLASSKGERDVHTHTKSVESELSNFYNKAIKLNRDELRVKIILDQEELDKAYRWISQKLNLDYIEPQAVLENDKNIENVDESVWEVYYIYIKLILQYHRRIKGLVQRTEEPLLKREIMDNLGLTYRLAFCKAMEVCNDIYQKFTTDTFIKKAVSNFAGRTLKLSNIWDILGYNEPTAFCEYIKKKRLEKIWRKYEANEKRVRSKFVSSQRIYLVNRIIHQNLNVAQGQSIKLIIDFFPLHDPYLLKGIKIQPYLKVFLDEDLIMKNRQSEQELICQSLKQFQGKKCASDFTRQSVQEKLEFKFTKPSQWEDISVQTIKNYCGERIAMYFLFRKFVTSRIKYTLIVAMVMQILLWVESDSLMTTGSSTLVEANSIILYIFSLFNIAWMTSLVQKWKHQQKNFEQKFGLENLTEQDEKSNLFRGNFMRSLENDNLNYEYVPVWQKVIKIFYSSLISVVFAMLVVFTVLIIFVLKGYFIETNASESTINNFPPILITLVTQFYNYIYKIISRKLTQFENHKTISQFQSSLIFKQFIVIFVNTFSPLVIYSFASRIFTNVDFCKIKTSLGTYISDCSIQVSNQMLAFALLALFFDIVIAIVPYVKFKCKEYFSHQKQNAANTLFATNHFESIDQFFEEQMSMDSFMYNEEVDNTSVSYTDFVVRLAALTLFGPSLPFAFILMYVNGILALHTNKFKILMLSRRTLPIKTKSIGIWSKIIQFLCFLTIVTNLGFVIYTRGLAAAFQARLFLASFLVLFLIKYYLSVVYSEPDSSTLVLQQRNEKNIRNVLLGVKRLTSSYVGTEINTDIFNVDYKLIQPQRKLPELAKANVRTK